MQSTRHKIISKFGIWHDQINRFIVALSKLAKVEKSEVEDWMMSKGITIFQNLRSGYSKISRYKDSDVNIDFVTPAIMLSEIVLAFEVLLNACCQYFTNSKEKQRELSDAVFHEEEMAVMQLTEAVFANTIFGDFIKVQCEITNALIAEQARKLSMDRNEIYDFVVGHFKQTSAKSEDHDLINMISNHLILMDEFMQYSQKFIENPSHLSGGLFKSANGN